MPSAAADSVIDGAHFAGLTVRAASLRGDDHRHAAETRQDSFGLWALEPPIRLEAGGPILLACVADGVGSQKLSHLGSANACQLVKPSVEAHLSELVDSEDSVAVQACQRVVAEVASGLRVLAHKERLEPRELSTTLTVCLVIPGREKEEGPVARAVLFYVGDSPSFILRERTWISMPLQRKDGKDDSVVDNRTDALPTRPEGCQVGRFYLCSGDMLMLCTDGLGTPLDRNPGVSEQLADWWDGRVPSLPEFYWQMSFRAQTYGDDRTAACIWLHDK